MATFAQLWKEIENLNEAKRANVYDYIRTFVDHKRAKTRVIDEIASKLLGQKPTPQSVLKAVESAIDRKSKEWREIAEAPVMQERRLAEHQKERQRLAATLKRARRRVREIQNEITALNKQSKLARQHWKIGLVCSGEMPDVPSAERTASEWASVTQPFAGVYFAFHNDLIQYVGESCNVPSRLRSHDVVQPHWMVAVLKLEPHQRFFAEAYYIWLMKPPLNKEGVRTLRELPSHLATFEPDTLDLADESKHE